MKRSSQCVSLDPNLADDHDHRERIKDPERALRKRIDVYLDKVIRYEGDLDDCAADRRRLNQPRKGDPKDLRVYYQEWMRHWGQAEQELVRIENFEAMERKKEAKFKAKGSSTRNLWGRVRKYTCSNRRLGS